MQGRIRAEICPNKRSSKPSAVATKWPPSPLPGLNQQQASPKYLSRCPEMEALATQINQGAQPKMTPELHAYAAAAGEFLKDADPRGAALPAAFLGLPAPTRWKPA